MSKTVKLYVRSADSANEVLAEVSMQDGPHADSHRFGDNTRSTLQVAFAHVFDREVKIVFESDTAVTDEPGLVFIP